ncbi:unnamed protein product, partial [marine sediment metagenome]
QWTSIKSYCRYFNTDNFDCTNCKEYELRK